ncbi:hypothetical protein EAG_10225 [Camponotus floridanus]|uniref:Secreted protein n=1 Tax=Camponotus floridanus TaxID=104421 RepID=E2A080_CAMFO|nr:hypothetical protein EAG_10225 [Camponotus floridanus]
MPFMRLRLCGVFQLARLCRATVSSGLVRVYARAVHHRCVVVNLDTGVGVVHEVVSCPKSMLPSIWDVLDILRAQEAHGFEALRGQRRVERLLHLARSGRNAVPGEEPVPSGVFLDVCRSNCPPQAVDTVARRGK